MNDSANKGPVPHKRGSFGFAWLLVGLAIFLFYFMRSGGQLTQFVGIQRPPLEVEGWLNTGSPLRNESLRGKVVLVDCWFTDCPPCRASMPHLVEFYNKFRDQGLVLVGLTPDSGAEVPAAREFVESVDGLDWPIGYGAHVPLGIMGVRAFPTLILFDASGTSVWSGHGLQGLESAVIKALAAET
jgi:thiol-disulfide isomerase/thioredoxin